GVERLLAERRDDDRIALARDLYSYLHLPMVAGIVLFAFAVRTALPHTGSELDLIPAVALCGRSALFLPSVVTPRLRAAGTLSRGRSPASVAFAALVPVALVVPALVALALVTAVWFGLHGYELIWWREARRETRSARSGRLAGGPAAPPP